MRENNYYRKTFWKNLSTRSYIKLLITIFFIFSIIGYASDIFEGFRYDYSFLYIYVIFSGLLGVFYAHSFIRQRKLFPIVLIAHFSIPYLLSDYKTTAMFEAVPDQKYFIFGISLIFTIMFAYIFLIIFISGEGIPQIKLRTEMELAKQIHENLVPEINFSNHLFEIYGKSIPISEVGGDLIDLYITNNNKLLCYIADVSGHGVSSGLLMGMFKSSIHSILHNKNSLINAFNDTNRVLHNLKKQKYFLTAAGVMFHGNNEAEFSTAGHVPILHFNYNSNKVDQLVNKQIPLTVKADFEFKSEKIVYDKGDIFILLSDGIIEVMNDNEHFSLNRVMEILQNNYDNTANELFSIIIKAANKFGKSLDDQSLFNHKV